MNKKDLILKMYHDLCVFIYNQFGNKFNDVFVPVDEFEKNIVEYIITFKNYFGSIDEYEDEIKCILIAYGVSYTDEEMNILYPRFKMYINELKLII
jgi:hypothetical protein